MSVRWDIHPNYLPTGTAYPVAGELRRICGPRPINVHDANNCVSGSDEQRSFDSLMSLTETHEGEHVSAALAAANDAANDLHRSWESMIGTSRDTLAARAVARAKGVQRQILAASAAVDQRAGSVVTKTIWYSSGGGWSKVPHHVRVRGGSE